MRREDFVCERCGEPIELFSDENDFICKTHDFVNAIHPPTGAVVAGDGHPGPFRIIRYIPK